MTIDEKPSGAAPAVTVGAELRQAREAHGISLRELSERTKIRQPVLRALEAGDVRQLPGGAIGRGFVKLYAREVGLDAHEMAERFEAERASAVTGDFGDGPGAAAGALSGLSSWFTPVRAAMVLGAVAVLALAYFASRPGPSAPTTDEQAPVAADLRQPVDEARQPVEPPAPSSPAAAPVPASAPPAATDPVPAGVVRVDLLATGDCWIAATSDGQQVIYRVLPAGERASVSTTTEAVVRIGMPANVTVTINGRPIRPFERPGSPITLRITPENYRDLVQP